MLTVAVLIPFLLLGHAAICVAAINRIHATSAPRWIIGTSTISVKLTLLAAASWLAFDWFVAPPTSLAGAWSALAWPARVYLVACVAAAAGPLPRWIYDRVTDRPAAVLRSNHTATFDWTAELGTEGHGPGFHDWVVRLPRNQMLQLDVNVKTLEIPRLDPSLDGLSIAHLSDLHYSGRVGRAFFDRVVEESNRLEADLVVVTGDVVDVAKCIEWIPPTLGRLTSRYGSFYVLGNHDRKVDLSVLRESLSTAGLIEMGGRWQTVDVGRGEVLLAGNELPWIAPAADLSTVPVADGPPPLRILLSHSPDQIRWARHNDFDLALAGHTHGGQIRFPWIGPLVAPSRYGVKYASGTYHEPPTVMHVSRGLSAWTPLRFNCRPELTKLVLRSAS